MRNKKILSLLTAVSLLSYSALPVVASEIEATNEGNGADTTNTVTINLSQVTSVFQENDADIHNKVDVDMDTGDNDVLKNTGGDVEVETGDANADVKVSNDVNYNVAEVDQCCGYDLELENSKNGADSTNTVTFGATDSLTTSQENETDIHNKVHVDGETGENNVNENTSGDVELKTGKVDAEVFISNAGSANAISADGDNGGSSWELKNKENGADTTNSISASVSSAVSAWQENDADLHNKVHFDGDTGDNDVMENTGGTVDVETGDIKFDGEISNSVNFNAADLEACYGCELDVEAGNEKNGADSKNSIMAKLRNLMRVIQDGAGDGDGDKGDNRADIDNKVDADADTGYNEVEENTGDELTTGDIDIEIVLDNSGNANAAGDDAADLLEDLLDLLGL